MVSQAYQCLLHATGNLPHIFWRLVANGACHLAVRLRGSCVYLSPSMAQHGLPALTEMSNRFLCRSSSGVDHNIHLCPFWGSSRRRLFFTGICMLLTPTTWTSRWQRSPLQARPCWKPWSGGRRTPIRANAACHLAALFLCRSTNMSLSSLQPPQHAFIELSLGALMIKSLKKVASVQD